MFVIFGVLLSICLPLDIPEGRCNANLSVAAQQFPDQFVFTARILLVGRSFGSPEYSYWSVARVQRRFPGLPSPTSDFVVFRGFFKRGERGEHFVDGRRGPGLLGRLLPIVEVYCCCRTQPLDRAALELRVLQDGRPKSGVRIVGIVYTDLLATSEPARGVKMLITEPGGSVTTTTDQQGIYDLVGLPAGHYSVQVESESERQRGVECEVKSGEVLESTLIARLAQP
jgi:hypothetical protein